MLNKSFDGKFSQEQFLNLAFFHKIVNSVRYLRKTVSQAFKPHFKKSSGRILWDFQYVLSYFISMPLSAIRPFARAVCTFFFEISLICLEATQPSVTFNPKPKCSFPEFRNSAFGPNQSLVYIWDSVQAPILRQKSSNFLQKKKKISFVLYRNLYSILIQNLTSIPKICQHLCQKVSCFG